MISSHLMEYEQGNETIRGGGSQSSPPLLTLQAAIDFGEYRPQHLSTFPEWSKLSRHMQWELIGKAMKNRRRQLWMQWAEVNNQPNFSKKPHLQVALKNIEMQVDLLQLDEEQLQVEYSR